MKKTYAYKSRSGILEEDPIRAAAWDLNYFSKQTAGAEISFTSSLWILNNQALLTELFTELKGELNDKHI